MSDEKTTAAFTTNVWTIRRPRRTLAVGQCASLLAALYAPIVVRLVWVANAAIMVATALLAVAVGLLAYAPYKNWRG